MISFEYHNLRSICGKKDSPVTLRNLVLREQGKTYYPLEKFRKKRLHRNAFFNLNRYNVDIKQADLEEKIQSPFLAENPEKSRCCIRLLGTKMSIPKPLNGTE